MKLPTLRTLPRPLKWLAVGLGVYVAYRLLVLALVVLTIAVSIVWVVGIVALLVAAAYAIARRL